MGGVEFGKDGDVVGGFGGWGLDFIVLRIGYCVRDEGDGWWGVNGWNEIMDDGIKWESKVDVGFWRRMWWLCVYLGSWKGIMEYEVVIRLIELFFIFKFLV